MGRSLAAAGWKLGRWSAPFLAPPVSPFVFPFIFLSTVLSLSLADAMPWCSKNMYIQSWLVALKM
jgi:hypothetical protein